MSQFYLTALQLALCLGPMALGIFISMKVFNIPDITTDGSYTLGAVVTATGLIQHWPAWVILPACMCAGALAGVCTGVIHTKLKIDALLAGILVMTGLYSVNLIFLGRSNVPLINQPGIFTSVTIFQNVLFNQVVIAICITVLLMMILNYVLKTDFGIAMRATGNNPVMTKSMGINNDMIKILGLAIANALTGLSGYLVAQYQNFTDINMGIGIVITGLGSVLIADALKTWMHLTSIGWQIVLVIVGSILFQMVLAGTLAMGIDPNWLKLVTALFVLMIVALPRLTSALQKVEKVMISLRHISKIFNQGKINEVIALDDISLDIHQGEFVVIIGANGSGKTTLMNIIEGSELPTEGSISIKDTEVTALPEYKRSKWVARVFQNPTNGTAPDLTILDNFRLAALRTQRKNVTIGTNAAFRKRVQEKISSLGMGLENKISQAMGSLSGGQRQALTLLMSVMDDTDILLLDEPTAALDPKSALVVMRLAEKLNQDMGITTILITHNLKDALQYGDRLIQFQEGKIVCDIDKGSKANLTLQDIYRWFA